jgi:aspartate racemase
MGCDAAILGCTELSVYRVYHGLPDFYVDALEVLVEQSITACGKRLRTV